MHHEYYTYVDIEEEVSICTPSTLAMNIEYTAGKIKFKQCNTQLQLITFILCSEVLRLYHEVSLYFQSMELMHNNYIMAARIWKANSNRFKSLGPQQRI